MLVLFVLSYAFVQWYPFWNWCGPNQGNGTNCVTLWGLTFNYIGLLIWIRYYSLTHKTHLISSHEQLWYKCKGLQVDETPWFNYPDSVSIFQVWSHAWNDKQSSLILCNFYTNIWFLIITSFWQRENKKLIEIWKAADWPWHDDVFFFFPFHMGTSAECNGK